MLSAACRRRCILSGKLLGNCFRCLFPALSDWLEENGERFCEELNLGERGHPGLLSQVRSSLPWTQIISCFLSSTDISSGHVWSTSSVVPDFVADLLQVIEKRMRKIKK